MAKRRTEFQRSARLAVVLLGGASLAACATVEPRYPSHVTRPSAPPLAEGSQKIGKPYQVGGIWYVPREQPGYDEKGIASWYGDAFHMKATANGEVFDMNAVSAAHTTLPLPSLVEVTNLDNGRRLVVRVNDRGPFVGDRIIDLSHEAARQLGYDRQGLARVRVRYVGPAPLLGPDAGVRYARAAPAPSPPPAAQFPATLIAPAEPVLAASLAPPLEPVTATLLPPLTTTPTSAPPPVAAATTPVPAPAGSSLRIQAAAYASEISAQRAVSQLSAAGLASIEPVVRDGTTLYRVVLPAPADEDAAYALRDRVAEFGFADARVVRSF